MDQSSRPLDEAATKIQAAYRGHIVSIIVELIYRVISFKF